MSQIEVEQEAFIRDFFERIPEASPLLTQHLVDNFDELLPHVLMADLTRWIIGLQRDAEEGNAAAAASRDRALAFLESRFSDETDLAARDVILASFLENVPQAGQYRKALVRHLGPTLRAAAARYS